MVALKDSTSPYTGRIDSKTAGVGKIAFGAALIRSAAGVVTAAEAANEDAVIGFAVQPANNVVLDDDFFYKQYDQVRVARSGEVNALLITTANTSIVDGDFLEVANLGDGTPGAHGLLEEAGNSAGDIRVVTAVAQAQEDVTMGSASYKQPASNVEVGATSATMSASDLAALNLEEGDLIYLRDVDGNGQLNRVKSLTSTVITFQLVSTVALAANTDYIHKVFQARVKIL